jgi:hypothetical protein
MSKLKPLMVAVQRCCLIWSDDGFKSVVRNAAARIVGNQIYGTPDNLSKIHLETGKGCKFKWGYPGSWVFSRNWAACFDPAVS